MFLQHEIFRPGGFLRTVLTGVVVLYMSALSPITSAQTIGPLTTTTPISHLTELVGAPNDVLTFATFDGNLGTLLSVVLSVNVDIVSTVTVTNNAFTASHGSVFTQSAFSIKDLLANLLLSPGVNTNSFSYSLAPGGQVTSSPALIGSKSATGTFTASPTLAEFTTIGAGQIALPVTTLTQTFAGNSGGNTGTGQVTSAHATGTITYNYTIPPTVSVPEPGDMALVTAGVISGVFIIRRRRRK
jgi:hypothetical protein